MFKWGTRSESKQVPPLLNMHKWVPLPLHQPLIHPILPASTKQHWANNVRGCFVHLHTNNIVGATSLVQQCWHLHTTTSNILPITTITGPNVVEVAVEISTPLVLPNTCPLSLDQQCWEFTAWASAIYKLFSSRPWKFHSNFNFMSQLSKAWKAKLTFGQWAEILDHHISRAFLLTGLLHEPLAFIAN